MPGARTELGSAPHSDLAGVESITFVTEHDVSARQIERHKAPVSRILYFRLVTDKPDRCLLVHKTADGLVTDIDIVAD
jgi:hypothetical protein